MLSCGVWEKVPQVVGRAASGFAEQVIGGLCRKDGRSPTTRPIGLDRPVAEARTRLEPISSTTNL
jgi:hypothetical protein